MYHFKHDNLNELYYGLCNVLLNDPEYIVKPRDLKINELTNVIIKLTNPYDRIITIPERKINMRYLIGELCFNLSCSQDLNFISHYSKFWNKVSDDNIKVNSAYGYRLLREMSNHISQYGYALECLHTDKDSRKAVMTIYNKTDNKKSKDNPCTMYLHFLIRNNELDLLVYMRSNDIWLGLTYDIPFFTLIQEIMLIELRHTYHNLRMGNYIHNVGSLHLYEKDFSEVSILLNKKKKYDYIKIPNLINKDIDFWFSNLLNYEKYKRDPDYIIIEHSSYHTLFQDWCIKYL